MRSVHPRLRGLGTIPTGSRVTILEANENNTGSKSIRLRMARAGAANSRHRRSACAQPGPTGRQPKRQPSRLHAVTLITRHSRTSAAHGDSGPPKPVPGGTSTNTSTPCRGNVNHLSDPVAMGAVPAGASRARQCQRQPVRVEDQPGNPANTNTTLEACQDLQCTN